MLGTASGIMLAAKIMGLTTISWWLVFTPILIDLGFKIVVSALDYLINRL